MRATERAKIIYSFLTSERKTITRESDIGKETGTIASLIETESARIRETEKERQRGNVGNLPLCISNNLHNSLKFNIHSYIETIKKLL